MSKINVIPHAIISNKKILVYNELDGYIRTANKTSWNSFNCDTDTYKGILSKSAKKNIRNIVQCWVNCLEAKKYVSRKSKDWMSYKMTFCTLTLPAQQFHSDKEIKRDMLNRFLIELKRKKETKSNLWVAEKQKNQNIHFHLLFEKFIEWQEIRKIWNNILKSNGYIEQYKINQEKFHSNGFKIRQDLVNKWSPEKQYNAYMYGVQSKWENPNTTDIHSLIKIENIENYITKYICKSIDEDVKNALDKVDKKNISEEEFKEIKNQTIKDLAAKYSINGAIWSKSENLLKLCKCNLHVGSELEGILYENQYNKKIKKIDNENYTIHIGNTLKELKTKCPNTYKQYLEVQNENYKIIYNT